jgi:hypothetical protein
MRAILLANATTVTFPMASCRQAGQPLAKCRRLSFHLHHHGSSAVKHHSPQILVPELADAK